MARSLAAPAPRRVRRQSSHAAPGAVGRLAGTFDLRNAAARLALRPPRARLALLASVLALPLLGGGWLLLRQSSLVAVRTVHIVGVHGPDAGVVDEALTRAARHMSTLDLNLGALEAAVAPTHLVRELHASTSFPHGLRIDVVEQLPVAALTVHGVRTAVAGDGVVLGPGLLSGSLPSVSGYSTAKLGRHVRGRTLTAELAVLGAAPWQLMEHAERVYTGGQGITVAMRGGLLVYFGSDQRAHAKWLSLARVLADPSSAGASYVDVRVPGHPAAGFPAGGAPEAVALADSSSTSSGGEGGTVAALAEGLPGGGSQSGPSAADAQPTTAGAPPSQAQTAPTTGGAEADSGEAAGATPPAAAGGTPATGEPTSAP